MPRAARTRQPESCAARAAAARAHLGQIDHRVHVARALDDRQPALLASHDRDRSQHLVHVLACNARAAGV
eukprot:1008256-Prymnesium_polylepis.1